MKNILCLGAPIIIIELLKVGKYISLCFKYIETDENLHSLVCNCCFIVLLLYLLYRK